MARRPPREPDGPPADGPAWHICWVKGCSQYGVRQTVPSHEVYKPGSHYMSQHFITAKDQPDRDRIAVRNADRGHTR